MAGGLRRWNRRRSGRVLRGRARCQRRPGVKLHRQFLLRRSHWRLCGGGLARRGVGGARKLGRGRPGRGCADAA